MYIYVYIYSYTYKQWNSRLIKNVQTILQLHLPSFIIHSLFKLISFFVIAGLLCHQPSLDGQTDPSNLMELQTTPNNAIKIWWISPLQQFPTWKRGIIQQWRGKDTDTDFRSERSKGYGCQEAQAWVYIPSSRVGVMIDESDHGARNDEEVDLFRPIC